VFIFVLESDSALATRVDVDSGVGDVLFHAAQNPCQSNGEGRDEYNKCVAKQSLRKLKTTSQSVSEFRGEICFGLVRPLIGRFVGCDGNECDYGRGYCGIKDDGARWSGGDADDAYGIMQLFDRV